MNMKLKLLQNLLIKEICEMCEEFEWMTQSWVWWCILSFSFKLTGHSNIDIFSQWIRNLLVNIWKNLMKLKFLFDAGEWMSVMNQSRSDSLKNRLRYSPKHQTKSGWKWKKKSIKKNTFDVSLIGFHCNFFSTFHKTISYLRIFIFKSKIDSIMNASIMLRFHSSAFKILIKKWVCRWRWTAFWSVYYKLCSSSISVIIYI